MTGRAPAGARPSPTGAARIAFSYLAFVLGMVVTGLVLAVWGLFTDRVCATASDVVCGLGWLWAGALVGVLAGMALTAWAFRLGWEWWVVMAAGVLAMPAVSVLPSPVIGVLVAAWPALAGGLTWTGSTERPAWRPWVVVGLAVLAVAASAVSVLV